jgi:NADH-quinone oxidoreductase subunit E
VSAPGPDEPPRANTAGSQATASASVAVPAELRGEIERHMALYPDPRSAALPALRAAQRLHGWCSPEAIAQVAAVMNVTSAWLESVASFYDMLETHPVGQHSVYVCTNISCSLRGADRLYEVVREAAAGDAQFNIRPFECLGACDIAPMASVDGVYVGPLSEQDVPRLLDDVRTGRPVLPDKQLATRLVADPHANSQQFPPHPIQQPASHGSLPDGSRQAAPPPPSGKEATTP